MKWQKFDETMPKPRIEELAEPASNYGAHASVYSEMDMREVARLAWCAAQQAGKEQR